MTEKRMGCQTPSRSFVLPYELTDGARAVEIYNSTGFEAQEWQELLLYDILAFNDEGLWVHTSFGFSLPRRNGKNEVVFYTTPIPTPRQREIFGGCIV